jgi:hypothetical protein
MAETLIASPAAPTTEEEETFEVTLEDVETPEAEVPEVSDLETEEPGAESAAEKEEPEKPSEEPAKPVVKSEPVKVEAKVEGPAKPEVKPEPVRERLHPAVRQERSKRKEYARLYAEAKDQLEAAEQKIRLLTVGPTAEQSPELKKWHEELAADADKATTMSEVLRLSIREMDRRDTQRVRDLNGQLYGLKCDVAEMRARFRHPDWEHVIEQAGLFRAIKVDAQGNFQDPALAQRVYYTTDGGLAPDPAERLYRLAVGKIEYERTQRGEPDPEEPEAATPPGPKGAEGAKAEPAAEAERRGAQRVIEQVSKNSTRPKGIRSVPKAGAGPTRVSKKYLDELLESDSAAYDRLLARSPGLERFHLGG